MFCRYEELKTVHDELQRKMNEEVDRRTKGKPQAAAVGGIGKIVVGASADFVKEQEDVSVDDEKLLELSLVYTNHNCKLSGE